MKIQPYHVSRKTIIEDFNKEIDDLNDNEKEVIARFVEFLGSNGYLNLSHIKFKVVEEEAP